MRTAGHIKRQRQRRKTMADPTWIDEPYRSCGGCPYKYPGTEVRRGNALCSECRKATIAYRTLAARLLRPPAVTAPRCERPAVEHESSSAGPRGPKVVNGVIVSRHTGGGLSRRERSGLFALGLFADSHPDRVCLESTPAFPPANEALDPGELEERIERYAGRAAVGVPLFDGGRKAGAA